MNFSNVLAGLIQARAAIFGLFGAESGARTRQPHCPPGDSGYELRMGELGADQVALMRTKSIHVHDLPGFSVKYHGRLWNLHQNGRDLTLGELLRIARKRLETGHVRSPIVLVPIGVDEQVADVEPLGIRQYTRKVASVKCVEGCLFSHHLAPP